MKIRGNNRKQNKSKEMIIYPNQEQTIEMWKHQQNQLESHSILSEDDFGMDAEDFDVFEKPQPKVQPNGSQKIIQESMTTFKETATEIKWKIEDNIDQILQTKEVLINSDLSHEEFQKQLQLKYYMTKPSNFIDFVVCTRQLAFALLKGTGFQHLKIAPNKLGIYLGKEGKSRIAIGHQGQGIPERWNFFSEWYFFWQEDIETQHIVAVDEYEEFEHSFFLEKNHLVVQILIKQFVRRLYNNEHLTWEEQMNEWQFFNLHNN